MTIHKGKMPRPDKIQLNLSAPEGNAFYMIALAKNLAKQLHMSDNEIDHIVTEMMSRDNDYLVAIFEEKFGEYVDIYEN